MNLKFAQNEGALLAGVCAGIARTFNWNVWVLRTLFVGFLVLKTFWAVIAYAALALIFNVLEERLPGKAGAGEGLASPELSERSSRITELEKRFRELEGQDR